MMRRHILSRHAAQTCIEPSKDTFWLSLLGFAGNKSSCTQHSRRAAPLDPSPVMQSCAARLNARLLKQSVNCELLCKLLFIPVRVTLKLEAHVCLGICYW